MTFLFLSLAAFVLFAAVFAATFAIDHFAEIWGDPGVTGWHGRFSRWAIENRTLAILQGASGLASALTCLACIVAMYYALTYVDVGGERRFALYITGGPETREAGAAREFSATRGELSRMPMAEFLDSRRIVKGRVSSIMPIGGGLTHVCVGNGEFCGLAASALDLKTGDVAYIRVGRLPSGPRRAPGWTITAGEARSLAATADFAIEEK
jgi:hypothetical protein